MASVKSFFFLFYTKSTCSCRHTNCATNCNTFQSFYNLVLCKCGCPMFCLLYLHHSRGLTVRTWKLVSLLRIVTVLFCVQDTQIKDLSRFTLRLVSFLSVGLVVFAPPLCCECEYFNSLSITFFSYFDSLVRFQAACVVEVALWSFLVDYLRFSVSEPCMPLWSTFLQHNE